MIGDIDEYWLIVSLLPSIKDPDYVMKHDTQLFTSIGKRSNAKDPP